MAPLPAAAPRSWHYDIIHTRFGRRDGVISHKEDLGHLEMITYDVAAVQYDEMILSPKTETPIVLHLLEHKNNTPKLLQKTDSSLVMTAWR